MLLVALSCAVMSFNEAASVEWVERSATHHNDYHGASRIPLIARSRCLSVLHSVSKLQNGA